MSKPGLGPVLTIAVSLGVMSVQELLQKTRTAARALRTLGADRRNAALECIAEAIHAQRQPILAANAQDVAGATDLPASLKDRLRLNEDRIDRMVTAVREVAAQADPLHATREIGAGRNGIRVTRRRIPLGVIAIVYEARPNVTAECAALTIKSGNGVVLRGGKEALASNQAVAEAVRAGLRAADLPPEAVALVTDLDRAE